MKKIVALFLIVILGVSLVSCDNFKEETKQEDSSSNDDNDSENDDNEKESQDDKESNDD